MKAIGDALAGVKAFYFSMGIVVGATIMLFTWLHQTGELL